MNKIIKTSHAEEKLKIGNVIASIRKSRKMRQRDLAEQAGISMTTILEIEKGRANITFDNMLDIAEALGVPFGYIYFKAFLSANMLNLDEKISCQLVKDFVMKIVKEIK